MEEFRVSVMCGQRADAHPHVIVVKPGPETYGATDPAPVRLQYECPESGEPQIARFTPPIGAGHPLAVSEVI